MTTSTPPPRSPRAMAEAHLAEVAQTKAHETNTTYGSIVRQLIEWNEDHGNMPWHEFTPADLNDFLLRERSRTSEVSQSQLSKEATAIRELYRYVARTYRLRPDFSVNKLDKEWIIPRGRPGEIGHPIPDDVWRQIWLSHLAVEDRLFLGLGYFCGLRRAEIARIGPEEVLPRTGRPGTGTLEFLRKRGARRNGISYADIMNTLSDPDEGVPEVTEGGWEWVDLLESIAAYKALHRDPYLLDSMNGNEKQDRQRLWYRFRRIQQEAGIPAAEYQKPHSMRHSAATNLALSGLDELTIQKQLSHADVEMTRRYISGALLVARHNQRRDALRQGRSALRAS